VARRERREIDETFVQQADDLETGVEDLSKHNSTTMQAPMVPLDPVFVTTNEDHSASVPTSQV
jgi:hypothetical protein